jgi:hypothetical protein
MSDSKLDKLVYLAAKHEGLDKDLSKVIEAHENSTTVTVEEYQRLRGNVEYTVELVAWSENWSEAECQAWTTLWNATALDL